MALTFEDAGIFKDRKWQCFCCGKNQKDYEEYKCHIRENHEQGREWIECPTCEAPVRCLKTHFKAKHPNRVIPTGVQTRVVVWKDFKPGKDGKLKAKGVRTRTRKGTFTSNKCGRDFEYKSGLEEEFFGLLEHDADVENWAYEPIKIPYYWEGSWHNYIPDLRITFIDGSTQIWEIKPANQTGPEYAQNQAKWAAAHNSCTNMGWEFVVVTEVGKGKLQAKIKRQKAILRLDEETSD